MGCHLARCLFQKHRGHFVQRKGKENELGPFANHEKKTVQYCFLFLSPREKKTISDRFLVCPTPRFIITFGKWALPVVYSKTKTGLARLLFVNPHLPKSDLSHFHLHEQKVISVVWAIFS